MFSDAKWKVDVRLVVFGRRVVRYRKCKRRREAVNWMTGFGPVERRRVVWT